MAPVDPEKQPSRERLIYFEIEIIMPLAAAIVKHARLLPGVETT